MSPDAFARLNMQKNAFAAGAPPRTPFGELTALPRPLTGFGGRFATGWEGDGRKLEGKETEEKETEGKGRRERDGRKRKGMGALGGEGPLRLRIPGNIFYPSPPLTSR